MKISLETPIPGPKSKSLVEKENRYLAPGLQRFATMAGIVVEKARGSTVTDVDNNTYIDIIGGIGVNGLGHSHPKLVQAIHHQSEKISVGSFTSQARVDLLTKLAEHRPSALTHRVQLYSSGSEAIESALRLAKSFTGKSEFVSFTGGFHGKTMGALSLMGSDFKAKLGPMVPGTTIVPYAYCYRCPMKLKYPSCGMACVELARQQIKMNTTGNVAAVIVEPQQGSAGNIIPPADFLPAIREVTDEIGALLIADEMITGFGRTGKYWGCQHSKTDADIVTIGKQFGGGYPISGVISRDEIVQSKPWGNPSGSSSSYGGNPLASSVACAALNVIDEENLVEASAVKGAYFLRKLKGFPEKYPFVGEVRGLGLFLAMEFVRDKVTKEPLSQSKCHEIFFQCLKRGLLTMSYDSRFRIQPAMTIDEESIDEAVDVLTEVFDELKNNWRN